jgi:hypothetical protein
LLLFGPAGVGASELILDAILATLGLIGVRFGFRGASGRRPGVPIRPAT